MSSGNTAIRVDGVTKEYAIYASPRQRLLSLLWPGTGRATIFRALDNVSFTVPRGETLGVIGRNGAGKSTLLQILCGTVQPTSGQVEMHGRFAALLELGAGFNPDFSGRENVYLNASLLGLSRQEIDARMGQIEAFADIGPFFERPVKTYSSGMYVRLAFSVAIHTEPDILVIDEALSVGDIRFQMKCLERIESLRARGTTILFVSHSLEQVKRFCQSAIWLEHGHVRLAGEASFVADRYRDAELMAGAPPAPVMTMVTDVAEAHDAMAASGLAPAVIESVSLSAEALAPFQPLAITVHYRIRDAEIPGFLLGVAIKALDGMHIFGPNTHLERIDIPTGEGRHCVTYRIPSFPLLNGTYRIDVGLFTDKGLVCLDYVSEAAKVTVNASYFSEGLVYIAHEWQVHDAGA